MLGSGSFFRNAESIGGDLYFSAVLIAASQADFAALSIRYLAILQNSLKRYPFLRANSTSRSLTVLRTNVSWLAIPHEQADTSKLIKCLMISSIASSFDAMASRSNWFL